MNEEQKKTDALYFGENIESRTIYVPRYHAAHIVESIEMYGCLSDVPPRVPKLVIEVKLKDGRSKSFSDYAPADFKRVMGDADKYISQIIENQ